MYLVNNVCDITEQMILNWIDQCEKQLKYLQNAQEFVHREYYQMDGISYSVEENLRDHFGRNIHEYKIKLDMMNKMLEQMTTTDNVELFDYQFPDTAINQLPENLRKEFFDFVYEM